MAKVTLSDIKKAVQTSGLSGFDGNNRELGGGEINDTFLLRCNSENVVLRVAKYTNQKTLIQEANALRLLNSNNIPKLIYFDENSRIKGRQWIVESYIAGAQVPRLSTTQFENLGNLLAGVHQVKPGRVGINIWPQFLDATKRFRDEKYILNHPDPEIRELMYSARMNFDKWQPKLKEISLSLIHCDATPSNVLVSGDDVSLIDWEFAKFSDPLCEFATVFYEDMECNQGKWRIHIAESEKQALYKGYTSNGGVIDEDRIKFWMNFDKLCSTVFMYWRINHSGRDATKEQMKQYKLDLENLIKSLQHNLSHTINLNT